MSPTRWIVAVGTGLALVLGLTLFVAVAGEPADTVAPASCAPGRALGLDKDRDHPGRGKGLEKDHPGRGKGLEKRDRCA
jgi:hypothetical protein